MKSGLSSSVRPLAFTLIILTLATGCGHKKESPVELYKKAEMLQKQAEDFCEKNDFDNAVQKYHEAIEKAKESAKSDWNLPNFLIEECEKGIVLVGKKAESQGLIFYEGRHIAVEEKERILKEIKEKEEEQRKKQEEDEKRRQELAKEQEKLLIVRKRGYSLGWALGGMDAEDRNRFYPPSKLGWNRLSIVPLEYLKSGESEVYLEEAEKGYSDGYYGKPRKYYLP